MTQVPISLFLALVFMALLVKANAEDKEVNVGNTVIKVSGQSGSIKIFSAGNETNNIMISPNYLAEIDTNGGKIVENQHTFDNFTSQEFTFSDANFRTFEPDDVGATHFSFATSITVDGRIVNLTFDVYTFTEGGDIVVAGESFTVNPGNVKFNVIIENWPFCGPGGITCQSGQTGEFLDFGIDVKGGQIEAIGGQDENTYSFGVIGKIIVPKKVIYDDNVSATNMPTGYPKLEATDGKQLFTFRFETFSSSAMYDPVLDLDEIVMATGGINTEVYVQRTSGMMRVHRSSAPSCTTTSSCEEEGLSIGELLEISVGFHAITEVNSAGTPIQTSSHMFNEFSSQVFDFGSKTDSKLQGLGVKTMTYMATLPNSAIMKVHLYLFREGGIITNGGEVLVLKEESVKFTVDISNWKFCGDPGVTCQNSEVGTHLDLTLSVHSSASPEMKTTDTLTGKVYSVGSGNITFSEKYTKDGSSTFTDLSAGYPQILEGQDLFKIRFEKFNSALLYDPIVFLNGSSTTESSVIFTFIWSLVLVLRLSEI